uniref:Reprolysin n=1 Tax=Rhipicephalus zambeziensis TaxID=60191 RepID=A0A224YGK0_9ACAR
MRHTTFTSREFNWRSWSLLALCVLQFINSGLCLKLSEAVGVVYPHLIEGRNQAGQMVLKVTDDITLNLEKSSVVGEEFLLRTYQGDIMEHNYLDGHLLEENLYHDLNFLASLIVSETDDLTVEGIIGQKYGIKPLPSQERTTHGNIPHVLYELTRDEYRMDTVRRPASSFVSPRQKSNHWPPRKIFVELLILADSAFRKQFSTREKMLEYLLITVNSVNIKYLTVSEPEVKVIFCALEVMNHIAENHFYVRHKWHHIIAYHTLLKLETHIRYHYSNYSSYDAVYVTTGLDMGAEGINGKWDSGTLGIAYIGGVCSTQKVGIGEDKAGTYSGVRVMAHELGHLLGCPHDSERYPGFSSRDCPWYDGYMMTYLRNSSNSMKFSRCCNQAITTLVMTMRRMCLVQKTAIRYIKKVFETHKLPGDVLKRDEVCRLSFPDVNDIRFTAENGTARCYATCFSRSQNKTLKTLLPDHSRCNETSVEGIESKHKVCVNGGCRTIRRHYPVEIVKRRR